jgi:hypothetical protein
MWIMGITTSSLSQRVFSLIKFSLKCDSANLRQHSLISNDILETLNFHFDTLMILGISINRYLLIDNILKPFLL